MGFSRREYRSGLPFPSPGDLPHPGVKIMSFALASRYFSTEPLGKPNIVDAKPVWISRSVGRESILEEMTKTDYLKGKLKLANLRKGKRAFQAEESSGGRHGGKKYCEGKLQALQFYQHIKLEKGGKSGITESRSVDSLRPHGLYYSDLGNSPGQNTGVGSLSLLQGIFPTQGSNAGLPIAGGFLTS